MTNEVHSCANPDCKVAEDGKCVEGYALNECPHFGQLTVEALEPAVEPLVPQAQPPRMLPTGETLTAAQTSRVKRRFRSRAIGIIGPQDAGKTSLIASFYDLLQVAPIGEISFAGSSTLVGLEKACHDARAASRRTDPHTERTIVGVEATFYHLDVRGPGFDDILSVLIGDRSGEDYLTANDAISNAEEFYELEYADVVTLLVNGAHLVDGQFRHEVKAVTPQVVDALVEAEVFSQRQRLAILLTKNDLVLSSPHAERAEADFMQMVDDIRARQKETIGVIEAFKVAASPRVEDKTKRGDGMRELIEFWIQNVPPEAARESPQAMHDRMIDLLGANSSEGQR